MDIDTSGTNKKINFKVKQSKCRVTNGFTKIRGSSETVCVQKLDWGLGVGLDNDKVYDSGLQNKMQDAVHLQLGFCIY